jgi:hypothetical protein
VTATALTQIESDLKRLKGEIRRRELEVEICFSGLEERMHKRDYEIEMLRCQLLKQSEAQELQE